MVALYLEQAATALKNRKEKLYEISRCKKDKSP